MFVDFFMESCVKGDFYVLVDECFDYRKISDNQVDFFRVGGYIVKIEVMVRFLGKKIFDSEVDVRLLYVLKGENMFNQVLFGKVDFVVEVVVVCGGMWFVVELMVKCVDGEQGCIFFFLIF